MFVTLPGLVGLLAERAALGEPGAAAGRLGEDGGAAGAEHDRLRVAEDGGDLEAAGALHVHEVRVGRLHQPLELVLPPLGDLRGAQQILSEL